MAWRLVDHTADAGIEAEGETLDEVFLAAAEAFLYLCTGLLMDERELRKGGKETLALSAEDGEELAVSWLNELLFKMETKSEVFIPETLNVSLSPPSVTAAGRTIPLAMDAIPVKSATYGRMVLRTSPRPFLRIFLDM